jgi:glutamyl-tRNA reductase
MPECHWESEVSSFLTELRSQSVERVAEGASTAALDRLVVVAATYDDLPTDRREAAATILADFAARLPERVMLHTCHRVELVAALDEAVELPSLPGLRRWQGAEAAERVLLVAGGLDSAVVAEEQLLGQVRDAYTAALARGETGPVLNDLFRRAVRFGKRVRSAANPSRDRSLADRALEWTSERVRPTGGSAVIFGTGEIGTRLALGLAAMGLRCTVASHSRQRGERLVERLAGEASSHRAVSTEEGLVAAGTADVIALATRTAGPMISDDPAPSTLVVDLCAPPGVEAGLRERLGDRLLDLDRLGGNPPHSASLSPSAERRLRRELAEERDRFVAWVRARGSGAGIGLLRDHAEEMRRRHVERLRNRADLAPEQLAAVEAMSSALVAELLHVPTVQLQHEPQAAEQIRRLFGIDP